MTKKIFILYIFVFCFCIFVACNILDCYVAKRPIYLQLRTTTLLTSPLNAFVHVGTPSWLRSKLWKSGIIQPSKRLFPNVQKVRDAFSMIQKEAFEAFKFSKPIMNDLYFQGIADEGWKRFYIKWYGPLDPLAKKICPKTCCLLQSLPEVHLGMFSILMPHTKIPLHFGPARMCLRYHLGISTPNDDRCYIRVGKNSYSWRDGEDIMFDDTVMHEVWNDTDFPRIVLFLDIERPQIKILEKATKSMIKYLGPMTTRTNDTQEKNEVITNDY